MAKPVAIGYQAGMVKTSDARARRPTEPRRRDAAGSQMAIRDAALVLFAERGFALTGVRDIATAAGVNSALVGRYFGTKEELFRTILEGALDMAPVLAGPRDTFGEHVVAIFADTGTVPNPLAMMLLSMGDAMARQTSASLIESRIIAPLADWLGPPDALVRARQLSMLWSGFLTHVQLLPSAPPGDLAVLRQWLAESTQSIVDRI